MSDRGTTFEAPSANDRVVSEIVRRLVDFYHPERIYLFGTAARGDAGPHSDYDFMVVVTGEIPKKARDVYRALRGIRGAVDVIVWRKEEFDKRLHLKASFPSTIVREGILLYGAGSGSTG